MSGNLVKWITEEAAGEPVEGVVIGEAGWAGYNAEGIPRYADQQHGALISWAEAVPLLDYDFDDGHGAPSCNAVHVWTASKVMFVAQYDGSTALHSVPRHPAASDPEMPGG